MSSYIVIKRLLFDVYTYIHKSDYKLLISKSPIIYLDNKYVPCVGLYRITGMDISMYNTYHIYNIIKKYG